MTPFIFLAVAIAGGLGAGARFLLDGLIRARAQSKFDWATTIINVSGSLVLGFIAGLTLMRVLPVELGIIVGTGFLGGYTTFSAASYETVELIRKRRYGAALLSGVGMLVASIAAALLGFWLGSLV